MTEHEIERLVVRLIGDQTEHLKMWAEAERVSDKGSEAIDSATEKAGKGFMDMDAMSSAAIKNMGMNMEALASSSVNKTGFMNMKSLSSDAIDEVSKSLMNMEALASSATDAMTLGMSRAGAEAAEAAKTIEAELAVAADTKERAMIRGAEVTRLVETTSERYARQLAELDDLLKKNAISQETYNRAVEEAKNGFNRLSESASVAAGVLAANMVERTTAQLKMIGKKVIHVFSEQEDADVALTSALESNGRAVRETFKDYQDFSAELQNVTRHADELVIALLTQAESFNITGKAARKATKDAIALAALPGARGSAESMLRLTAAMAQGNVQMAMMFARMVPQLRHIKDESKFMVEYQRLVAAGFDAESAAAKTYSGAMEQASNVTNDLGEDFGMVAANVIKPWIKRWKEMVAVVKGFSPVVKELMVIVAGAVIGLVGFMLAFNNIATTLQVLGPLVKTLFLGTAGTIGLTPGAFIGLAAAIVLAAAAIYKLNPAVQEFNEAIKRSNEINDQWIARIKGGTSAAIDRAKAMSLPAGRDAIAETVGDAQKQVEDLETAITNVKKKISDLGGGYLQVTNIGEPVAQEDINWLDEFLENRIITKAREELKEYKEQLSTAKTALEDAAKAQQELNEAIEAGPTASKETLQAIEEMTHAIDLQNQTFGMSERAAAMWKFGMQDATKAELDALDAVMGTNEHLKEQAKATEKATEAAEKLANTGKSVNESLDDQILSLQMGADAALLFKLAMDGMSGAELLALYNKQQFIESLKKEKELMDESKRITEQYAEPWEKLAKEKEKLDELLFADGGAAISFDTYSKALADAEDRAYDTRDAVKSLNNEMKSINGLMYDSAEAFEASENYFSNLAKLTGGQTIGFDSPDVLPDGVVQQPVAGAGVGAGAVAGVAGGAIGGNEDLAFAVDLLRRLVELAEENNSRPVIELSPSGV